MSRPSGRPSIRSATTTSSTSWRTAACCTNAIAAEGISQQAPRAPHAPQGAYPGTCRDLTDAERDSPTRRDRAAARAAATHRRDRLHRSTICCTARTPGSSTTSWSVAATASPAYNLAVVVDDAAQGVDQVVRGDDLLPSSPRQAYLARLLGYPEPTYAHVALVLNEDGARLAKRDGAVTLAEIGVQRALAQIAASLGWQANTLDEMLTHFDQRRCRGNRGSTRLCEFRQLVAELRMGNRCQRFGALANGAALQLCGAVLGDDHIDLNAAAW